MTAYDLVIKGGTVVTATDSTISDVGVRDGIVMALGRNLDSSGAREIDATGRLVMPGGIDSHCHIEQVSGMGVMCADDFYSGSVSAAVGGTTSIIPL
ncbi:MAG: dihydropyrimidinase, partial [Alphaproteobacteria bacterium]